MKKFKDFLYDKNDILISLLVLACAALIIVWRMDAIMSYPERMLNDDKPSVSQGEEDGQGSEDSHGGQSTPDGNGKNKPDGADKNGQNGQDGNDGQGAQDSSLWSNGMLTKDVDVNVEGSTATAAIGCLVEAGLFEDYAEYQKICEDAGFNHEKVSAGLLTFKKGSTKKEIADRINWS